MDLSNANKRHVSFSMDSEVSYKEQKTIFHKLGDKSNAIQILGNEDTKLKKQKSFVSNCCTNDCIDIESKTHNRSISLQDTLQQVPLQNFPLDDTISMSLTKTSTRLLEGIGKENSILRYGSMSSPECSKRTSSFKGC